MRSKFIFCTRASIFMIAVLIAAMTSDSASHKIMLSTEIRDKKGCCNMCNTSEDYSKNNLYTFLSSENNRQKVMKNALKLNGGQYTNACVYFAAEALRQNSIYIPEAVCNTDELVEQLKSIGWICNFDYKELQPGDICFTTDLNGSSGSPSHTYIFMSWLSSENYDYAMVCDNQVDRYGTVYHIRNIAKSDIYNGERKEAFRFFMRK